MNIYDFDKTIFQPDSSACFIRYCLRHRTLAVSKAVPKVALEGIRYLAEGRKDARHLKEALFSFLNRIDNIDELVSDFWKQYADHMQQWYLDQKREDDLIISASPYFLLSPMTERLGVRLIATEMNPYTGKISGNNCHDAEKKRRYLERYRAEEAEAFYSDSLSDTPMAELAREAFLVSGDIRTPWPGLTPRPVQGAENV